MRMTVRIAQVFVAVLFILSGLVKANDPVGLGFKMQEFFEIWNADLAGGNFFAKKALIALFDLLHGYALALSITMITLEIMAGVALLLGWKKRFVLWLLLVLMLFFTFLTAYAFLSTNADGAPKFTNCGCFGDCLPLEPSTSFWKDIILLALILLLIIGQKHLFSLFTKRIRAVVLVVSLVLSLLLQWYVLNYLPLADCLPFKKGNNLPEKMKPPVGSVPSVYETRLVYRNTKTNAVKDMSQDEFNNSRIWEDPAWKWDTTITKLVRKGTDIPAIQGFSLVGKERFDSIMGSSSKADSTDIIMAMPKAIIGFGLEGAGDAWLKDFSELLATAQQQQVPVFFASNNPGYFEKLFETNRISMPVFSTDFTVIRTAARTNPAFYYLQSGTIKGKYSYRQLDQLGTAIKPNTTP